ncbi:MAG: GIY-YIG nuclease family protein [Candidatus Gracilibacteria bacterium]|nr:GIY-YIG nuclease family protein [Candidatus Gracilibacteria bacterium]
MAYFTYILKCADSSLYTGITTDLDRRLREHNGELIGGAKYTLARKPCELLYHEEYENRSEASKREIEIKKMKREKKLELISKNK